MLNFAVIGYGYWGPNVVRNLVNQNEAKVDTICDVNPKALKKVKGLYPGVILTRDYKKAITSPKVDAVAIVTPISQHYQLAKLALESGKHIFIEKPFTGKVKEAEKLIDIARKNKCQIMVDHTFIFTGAVKKIKEIMDKNTLGQLNYYDSTRAALGLFQHDVNVIWDLAPHDFAILDYVIKSKPLALTAQGIAHTRGHENIAYITVYYPKNLIVHINVNWMSPVKIRTTLICGNKKMLIWDDLQTDEKIKIYDKGIKEVKSKDTIDKLKVEYRLGDMTCPHIEGGEALKKEIDYFIKCLKEDKTPVNDGHAGLRVVKMLEKVDQSLKNNGKLVKF